VFGDFSSDRGIESDHHTSPRFVCDVHDTVSDTAAVTMPVGAADPNGLDNSSTESDEVVTPRFADGFESGNTRAWSWSSPPVLSSAGLVTMRGDAELILRP